MGISIGVKAMKLIICLLALFSMLLSPLWLNAEPSADTIAIVLDESCGSPVFTFSDYSKGSLAIELPEVGITVNLVKECYGVLDLFEQEAAFAVVEYMPEMALG